MANVKISDLTAASAVADANQFEINEAGSSKRVTASQIKTYLTGSDLDMGGNKVLFANVYSALSDLPNASTYHGMFAHVHATGKGYFAHGGNWIELQNASDTVSASSGGTFSAPVTITTSGSGDALTVTSTDAGDSFAPDITFYRNSSSPADNDGTGLINFRGRNDNNQDVNYVQIQTTCPDVSDGAEDGFFSINTMVDGSLGDRITISSSGKVGINEGSPSSALHVVDGAGANIGIQSTAGSHWRLGDGVGASNGTFVLYDYTNSAARLAIESTGRTTALATIGGHHTKFQNTHGSSPDILWLNMSGAAPDNNSQYFVYCSDSSTLRCAIWSDGDIDNHDNSYGGTSDQKLKQQITDASSQWDDIKALQVRKFKFNSDVETGDSDEHWRLGVIAQEVEASGMSGLVNDRVDKDEDGNDLETTTKSVKYSVLYMKAVKALQEAMDRIETLETENVAIKARLDALEAE